VVTRAPPPAHEQPRLPSTGSAAEFLSRGFDRNELRDKSGRLGFSPGTRLLVTIGVVGVFLEEMGPSRNARAMGEVVLGLKLRLRVGGEERVRGVGNADCDTVAASREHRAQFGRALLHH
jgi:hypothetical protein